MDRPVLIAVGNYPDWDVESLIQTYDLHRIASLASLDEIDEGVRGTVRAVAYKDHGRFDGAMMDRLPELGLIANFGVGYDAISVPDADARGVKVTNSPDVLNDDVADLAVAMWIAEARRMVQADAWVRSGRWSEGAFPLAHKASGRRVGILGLGRIGHDIATRLAAFKCEIHYTSRSEKDTPGWTFHADAVDLAGAVDDLFVALVGGPDTAGAVDADVLAALGPDGVLINISRGSVVNEAALLDALEQGTIRGAGLDVFASEPDCDPRFRELDNVVLQPHQGSATGQTRRAMGQLQRDNIAAFFAGEALKTPVN